MQRTELCLVRHGETDWNAQERIQGCSDIPLNARGREQARTAARTLAREAWDAIVASPLSRAFDTARAIAAHAGFEESDIARDERLMERHFGEAEGMNYLERRARFGSTRSIPGSEPWEEVGLRGAEAMEEFVRTYRGKRIIAVAHGGLINSTLEALTNGEYGYHRGGIQNGGLTLLVWNGSWSVEYFNRSPNGPERDRRTA